MRESYLRKLLGYMKKVYKIENTLASLSDDRVNWAYRTSEVILLVLLENRGGSNKPRGGSN